MPPGDSLTIQLFDGVPHTLLLHLSPWYTALFTYSVFHQHFILLFLLPQDMFDLFRVIMCSIYTLYYFLLSQGIVFHVLAPVSAFT